MVKYNPELSCFYNTSQSEGDLNTLFELHTDQGIILQTHGPGTPSPTAGAAFVVLKLSESDLSSLLKLTCLLLFWKL